MTSSNLSWRLALGGLILSGIFCANTVFAETVAKVGIVTSRSGPLAYIGEDIIRGIQYTVDQANAKAGPNGLHIKLSIVDDEGSPAGGLRAAERLTLDGNRIITGTVNSAVILALAAQLERLNATLISAGESDALIGSVCNRRYFHPQPTAAMNIAIFGPWMKDRPEKSAIILASDFSYARGAADDFAKIAKANGRDVTQVLFAPLGTKDFGPYIQQILNSPAQMVFVTLGGDDSIAFAQQAGGFNLQKRKTITSLSMIYTPVVKAVGPALDGVWGDIGYDPSTNTPENKEYVASWRQKFGHTPNETEWIGYLSGATTIAGITKAGSDDPVAVAKALRNVSVTTPIGTFKMRPEDHQLMMGTALGRVEKVNDVWQAVPQAFYPGEQTTPPVSPDCKMKSW